MENQHRKISGYRELTQHEIDLMNKVKCVGLQLTELVDEVRLHVESQKESAVAYAAEGEEDENDRLIAAEPEKWLDTGESSLQMGLMFLTRAVAQPTTF